MKRCLKAYIAICGCTAELTKILLRDIDIIDAILCDPPRWADAADTYESMAFDVMSAIGEHIANRIDALLVEGGTTPFEIKELAGCLGELRSTLKSVERGVVVTQATKILTDSIQTALLVLSKATKIQYPNILEFTDGD